MNYPICFKHSLPIHQICGQPECCFALCQQCFSKHRQQRSHSTSITLSIETVAFFIEFSEYLRTKMIEWESRIAKQGYQTIFKITEGNDAYICSRPLSQEITSQCFEAVIEYKNLMMNNKNYVLQNKQNVQQLFLPLFLKDIYNLITKKWEFNANMIINNLKEKLIVKFPFRNSYKNIRFAIQDKIVNEIEKQRMLMVEKIKKQSKRDKKLMEKKNTFEERMAEQNIFSEISHLPNQMRIVQSFYQVLDKSETDNQNSNSQILQKLGDSAIFTNFLPYETLQKQIEQLLRQNQKIKQQNMGLRFENSTLRTQNMALKNKKK